jgi:hypothetical protein
VARIAPTTSGIQATRASVFTLSEKLSARDVSEGCVNPSPASVPTPEAGDYRPRRSAAKPPEYRQDQGDQEPRQGRAAGEYDLSEPRTRLYSKDGSGQPSTHGAEQTSQPAGLHASAGTALGKVAYRTLGTMAHEEQDAVLPTAALVDPPIFVGEAQTEQNAAGPGTAGLRDERAFNEPNP